MNGFEGLKTIAKPTEGEHVKSLKAIMSKTFPDLLIKILEDDKYKNTINQEDGIDLFVDDILNIVNGEDKLRLNFDDDTLTTVPVQEFRNQMMQISKDHDMDIRIKRLLIKDFLIGEHGILKNTTNTMDGKEYYTLLELKGHWHDSNQGDITIH